MLDSRPAGKKRSSPSGSLPALRPRRGKCSAHSYLLCFRASILVWSPATFKLIPPDAQSVALTPLLIGGEGLGRNYRNSIGRASTPYAFLELGFYGNIGMHLSLMGWSQICCGHSRISRMNPCFGGLLGLRGLLPWTQEGWLSKFRTLGAVW